MDKREHIAEIYNEVKKTDLQNDWSSNQKSKIWFDLFNQILEQSTKEANLYFTTIFSKLAYVGTKYRLNSRIMHLSHLFRKGHQQDLIKEHVVEKYAVLGRYVCCILLKEVHKVDVEDHLLSIDEDVLNFFNEKKVKVSSFRSVVEAVVFEVDTDQQTLHFYEENDPSVPKTAKYNVHNKNELFTPNIESITKTFQLPLDVNFIDTDIGEDGIYYPTGLVIQPDRLMDVTSVSSCFNDYGAEPFLYLINKFKAIEATIPILTGNLVNYILDELVNDPAISFKEMVPKLFRYNPLGFAVLDDDQVRSVLSSLHAQYRQLLYTVQSDFRNKEIDRERIFLEPSFYSRDYGIQGRLDLLHVHKDSSSSYDIIELKSGKTFRPNVYGINASHYIQTLLYDLMVKSAFQPKTKSFNYILYSKEEKNSLRFAPPVRTQQYEALKLRNDLIAIEYKLTAVHTDNRIFEYIKPENFELLKGFNKDDVISFHKIYSSLNTLQSSFFNYYTAFVAREHYLAKIGGIRADKQNGHAALWLETRDEKADRFSIMDKLQIQDNRTNDDHALITFLRSDQLSNLVDFRVGDIVVLYISDEKTVRAVLKNQIFKCTIIELNQNTVTVKLRNKQYNQSLFTGDKRWALEPDSLDSGFNGMYKNLYSWAASSPHYKDLYMGLRPPAFDNDKNEIDFSDGVTTNQGRLLNKMLRAKDYFILWGPPGTGKTSMILKNLTKYLHENTEENVLLLAYTNRAVDEICEAVCSIHPDYIRYFVRLGSRNATSPKFTHNLIDELMADLQSRKEIIDQLSQKRIFISTVSSIFSKPELLKLKKFDTAIIDEASQILEPMLCGLLSNFRRFLLIGDHKQLPAVVVQDADQSTIADAELQSNGFYNTRVSMFERLYMQCVQKGWMDAYSILDEQGRMHTDLMAFPNLYFYDNQLQALQAVDRLYESGFFKKIPKKYNYLQHRTIFIDTPADNSVNWKTNHFEAQKCIELISVLMETFNMNNKEINEMSVGIITPYRAQIALIRQYLEKHLPDMLPLITVDTVERYQGGARDIIIISMCINKLSQLDNMVSLSQEGVDRKLNVALTRAKEQIVIIGNEDLLSNNVMYNKLINSYHKLDYYYLNTPLTVES